MALYAFQFLNPEIQREHKEEILAAFDAMLETNPDEFVFTQMMRGIVLFPEMLYRLVKWDRR